MKAVLEQTLEQWNKSKSDLFQVLFQRKPLPPLALRHFGTDGTTIYKNFTREKKSRYQHKFFIYKKSFAKKLFHLFQNLSNPYHHWLCGGTNFGTSQKQSCSKNKAKNAQTLTTIGFAGFLGLEQVLSQV